MQITLKRHVSVLAILAVALLCSGCPLPQAVRTAINTGLPSAPIGAAYTGTPPASVSGWSLTGATVPAGSWMTYNATTRTIVGTPGGNDFGNWPVTVTYSDGSKTKSYTTDVVVPDPTWTLAPTSGFVVPYHSSADTTITFGSTATTPYTYTYTHTITGGGPSQLAITGPTTTTSSATLSLHWQLGGDFQAEVYLDLVSAAPGRGTLRITIPAISQ